MMAPCANIPPLVAYRRPAYSLEERLGLEPRGRAQDNYVGACPLSIAYASMGDRDGAAIH
jgi:hypothetical protein